MNRIYFPYSKRFSIAARFILLGLVLLGLILPVGVQAVQFPDFTATPEALTPTATASLPPVSAQEYNWLSFPADASQLASDRPLALLAGDFIFHGLVDASSCADGSMLETGAASVCGEAAARNAVIVWQNQFDAEILKVAQETGVPPFILKNVFMKESQFWPETYRNPTFGGEYSLGHLTTMGVDTLLRWNRLYYKKLCNQNFNEETCRKEYVFQDPAIQDGLKGVIISSINADCSTCLGGVSLEKARNSVSVTAAMLIANRNHVQWLVKGFSLSSELSPENSWRFTLASYNAGPNCFTQAFYGTRGNGNPLSWKDVSKRFGGACQGAVKYVSFMEEIDTADPAALVLASSDTSSAARLVLGPLATPTTVSTPTIAVTETPTVSSLTATPVTETPTVSSLTVTPVTETPTVSSLTVTSVTETPTVSSLTVTPVTETPTVSSLTVTPVTETSTVSSPTATLVPTETPVPANTPIPTNTLAPVIQPTAFLPASNTETGEIVVKFGGLVPEFLAESAVGSAGGEIQTQMDALGLTIVSAPEDQIPQVLASLQDNLLVDYAEPNYTVQAFYTPTDPDYVNQTYLADMQIPEAWDVTKGEGIIVAVIDTGVDVSHPDLASSIWVSPGEDGLDANGQDKRTNYIDDDNDGYVDNWMGWNFVNNNNDARDINGHGTHTAGIIAAQMDNAQGISGIAPNARIMAIKALDDSGFGAYSQVAQSIIYAVDHGAKVINLGFGGTANSEILLAATNYAYDHNVMVVAAGGNTGAQTLIYPAANPKVIAVSALNQDLSAAAFSSYSNAIQISAPGVGIYSTTPGGNYASMSGTSMSAAQVSGVAALLFTLPQFDTVDKIREALFSTSFDLGDPGLDAHYGYGLIHAFDGLNYVPGSITATPMVSPTPDGSPTLALTAIPVDPGGVFIMTDMAASTINTYARSCGVGSNPNYGTVVNYTAPLGGAPAPGLLVNDGITPAIPIGFEFWYMGTRYTQVIASSNGWLSFGAPGGSYPGNDLDNNLNLSGVGRPYLAPLWDDLGGAGGGGTVASYTTTGTAPNRAFTFEWWNYQWNSGTASRVSSRVVLHETTGDIDFQYFQNNTNGGTNASIGITGTGNASFISAQDTTACPVWSTAAETATLNTKPPSDTRYTFSPAQVTLNAPSNLNMTNVTTASLTLNWTDNSAGEDGFGIYTSTDGVNYTYFGQVAANITTFNAAGLANSANNYWKVYAVVEGNASAAADVSAPSALNFTGVAQSTITLNWTDNSNNEAGFYIFRSTNNVNFTQVAKTAANVTSYDAFGLTPSTTYYWRVQAVGDVSAETTITAAATSNQATSALTSADMGGSTITTYATSCTQPVVFAPLTGATPVAAVVADNALSAPIPLGFDFWYMGARYTQVYASSNGWLSFGSPANSYNVNDLDNGGGAGVNGPGRPFLAPLWDNLDGTGGGNGAASYLIGGAAPNRTFTFEWLNWRWDNGATSAKMSFQAVLHESTGIVDFNYRQEGTAMVLSGGNTGASIGITGAANNSFLSASNVGVCPPNWSNVTETNNLITKPLTNSRYTFNPNSPVPAAPSNLNLTNVTNTSVTLNWQDNSNNEDGFGIYTSTDGVNYFYVGQAAANATSFNVAGLANSANNYWKVYAVVEGAASAAADVTAPGVLNFTAVTQTGMTLNWADNSSNETGFYIFQSTDNINFTSIVKTAADATSYPVNGLTMGVTYYWRVQAAASAIAETTMSAAAAGSQATLPNTPPVVNVTSPANNSSYVRGVAISFTASALDAESGDLSSSLQWTSNIDGAIGSGNTFTKSNLSFGVHTITARVTDPNGGTGSASITVTVTDNNGNIPPVVAITAPADLSSYTTGTNITFTGTSLDNPGDGDISAGIVWTSSINGNIGVGASISTAALSVGVHTISATSIDSGGLTGTKTIRVTVTDAAGNAPPMVTILYPSNGASFPLGSPVGFIGNASINVNGDISANITWKDGAATIGAGSSFGLSSLSVGVHTITASVTDANNGLSSTESVTITINAPSVGDNPHESFNGSTEQCATCHRNHSAQQGPALIDSTLGLNDFCLTCHNNAQKVVSTHSNMDWVNSGYPNPALEEPFELQCVQCHDPHGNNTTLNYTNRNYIRPYVWLNSAPSGLDPEAGDIHSTSGPVRFTALTNNYSFDDGGLSGGAQANRICVTCHVNSSMTRHPGGANHGDGTTDYTTLDCTQCHPHSMDSSAATRDGFQTTCRACHSDAQTRTSVVGAPARRQIVSNPVTGPTGGDFKRTSHHVDDSVTDADCLICHEMLQHKQGTVRLFNEDTGAVYALDYTKPSPYNMALDTNDPAEYEAFCLSCHDANGRNGNTTPFSDKKLIPQIDTNIWSASQHNVIKLTFSASCLDCHSNGHGSNKTHMQSSFAAAAPWDWAYAGAGVAPFDVMDQEENFCFKCHQTGSVTGTPVQPAFTTYTNTPTRFFKHDVGATYTAHDSKEVFSSRFASGVNRHVECDDCHGPHADKAGASIAPTVKPENIGASGVNPVYGGAGAPGRYNFLSQISYEYQFCFKCHSSYTTLPTYLPDGYSNTYVADGLQKLTNPTVCTVPGQNNCQVLDTRDMAKAFNPNNGSFHPVMAVGKNQNMPTGSLTGTWTQSSMMYCSDCHTNSLPATGGNGTHGSSLLHILAGANNTTVANYWTVDSAGAQSDNEICFKCHSTTVYGAACSTASTATRFYSGENLHCSKHGPFSCYDCHNSHGSEQQHLINFNFGAGHVNAVTGTGQPLPGSEGAFRPSAAGGTCALSCHGQTHNEIYP